ncbi:major facilitator superfamily domain-containing protein [Lophiotrema nucula]|uniref:Major facilitator superfamily domain-containing protein n=1 Tax=Lophiotrema nucula TaxID=690887 RepID=A0A6A5YW01_9PLEO|nr:major facilitator superfamily domain-containing protein [Lophiotrema nucula]
MATEEHHPVTWFRSTLWAALLGSVTALTCPGIFGALNGMGAGGGASPDITNAANAIVFGTLAARSPFTESLINRITPKWALCIGTLGYVPYAAGLYCNDRFGTNWLLLFGAVCIGVSACFLWVASGAILLGYSEEHRKGRASLQSLGASIGGIVSLALNIEKSWRGSVSTPTYIALMIIMCLGFPFAALLPTAKRIQRTDGRPVQLAQQASFLKEFRVLKNMLKRPAILALMPLWLYGQWFLSYQWQFNFAYFTVRARALNSTLFYLVGLFSALLMGQILDFERFSRRMRARIGFFLVLFFVGASWILGQVVQVHHSKTTPTLDWSSDGFGLGAFLFILWGFSDPFVTTFMFWLGGTLTRNLNETSFLAAVINFVGSLGSTFGFVVSAMDVEYDWACVINVILFFVSVPFTAWVVFAKVTDSSHGKSLAGLEGDKSSSASVFETPAVLPVVSIVPGEKGNVK